MRKVRATIMASAKMQQKDIRARVWLGSKALTVKSVMQMLNYVIIEIRTCLILLLNLIVILIMKRHFSDINECASRPCGKNGHCDDKLNGYQCRCIAGYSGINCKTGIAILSFYTHLQ